MLCAKKVTHFLKKEAILIEMRLRNSSKLNIFYFFVLERQGSN